MTGPLSFSIPFDGGVPQDGRHLSPTFQHWPDPERGPWMITFYWQMINSRAECVGLEITSIDYDPGHHGGYRKTPEGGWPQTGQPVTTSLLRSLKLGDLIAWHRGHMSQVHGQVFDQQNMAAAYAVSPTMRKSTENRLRRVAEVYQAAWAEGAPPTRAVATQLGISNPAAAKLVSRARSAGFLPVTSQGRAGGGH